MVLGHYQSELANTRGVPVSRSVVCEYSRNSREKIYLGLRFNTTSYRITALVYYGTLKGRPGPKSLQTGYATK